MTLVYLVMIVNQQVYTYAFGNCKEYLAEMNDYKSGVGEDADLWAYYNQYMEIDAREYSQQAILEHRY